MMTIKNGYTQEERLLAGLAHASIVTGVIGLVASLLIYITQKEKSAYTARQALQAVFYQLIGSIVVIVAWSCWGVFYALTFIPLITNAEQYQDAPPPIFWIGLGSMILPFIVMAIWGLYGLYGAIQVWLGKDFHYAFIGRLKILS
jgi:hypothetical protein